MRRQAATLAAALSACAPPGTIDDGLAPVTLACWPGFTASATGPGCEPLVPPQDCPPGTWGHLGSGACEPIGVPSCPMGFAADPSGWGCADVTATGCTGATMPQLGSSTCADVSDCAAPWPPAGATAFVSPSGPTDATHFNSIQAAIVAQTGPGAVIAVDPGTYVEAMQPLQPMTVVGRCAAQVIVQSPGANNSGLRLRHVAVTLEGLTLKGHYTGAAVDTMGALTLKHCVLDGNREIGATVDGAGSSLTLEGSLIRGTTSANAAYGRGVQVQNNATATVSGSALLANQSFGAYVLGPSSTLTLTDSIVAQTVADVTGAFGVGATADHGQLNLERCAVFSNRVDNVVFAGGTGSVKDSVIRDGVPVGPLGNGLLAQEGAVVTVDGTTLSGNTEAGLAATDLGTQLTVTHSVVKHTRLGLADTTGAGSRSNAVLTLDGCALVDNVGQGLAVETQSAATVRHTLIRDTLEGGTGIKHPRAIEVLAACATMSDVSVVHNHSIGMLVTPLDSCPMEFQGVWVNDVTPLSDLRGTGLAHQGGQLHLFQSAISNTADVGLFVYGGATFANVEQSSFSDAHTPDNVAGNAGSSSPARGRISARATCGAPRARRSSSMPRAAMSSTASWQTT
jgi:hypothetical protein